MHCLLLLLLHLSQVQQQSQQVKRLVLVHELPYHLVFLSVLELLLLLLKQHLLLLESLIQQLHVHVCNLHVVNQECFDHLCKSELLSLFHVLHQIYRLILLQLVQDSLLYMMHLKQYYLFLDRMFHGLHP